MQSAIHENPTRDPLSFKPILTVDQIEEFGDIKTWLPHVRAALLVLRFGGKELLERCERDQTGETLTALINATNNARDYTGTLKALSDIAALRVAAVADIAMSREE